MVSLASIKRDLRVGTKVELNNLGKGINRVGIVVKVQTNGFYVGFPVTKEQYYDSLYGGAHPRNFQASGGNYYRVSFVEWQLARDTRIEDDTVTFLNYEVSLSGGGSAVFPFSHLGLGSPWLILHLSTDKEVTKWIK